MKTAMQELKEKLIGYAESTDNLRVKQAYLNSVCAIEDYNLLEKEKQQIIDCSIETTQDCWKSNAEFLGVNLEFSDEDLENQRLEAEQYYSEKFKND